MKFFIKEKTKQNDNGRGGVFETTEMYCINIFK